MKTSLKSSSTIYDYVKVQQLDDICQISVGNKKQTRRQNMAEIVFSWGGGGGGSEIKCIIFKENNDNPFDNPHDIFLPGILVILCIISNLSGVVHGHFLVKYYGKWKCQVQAGRAPDISGY